MVSSFMSARFRKMVVDSIINYRIHYFLIRRVHSVTSFFYKICASIPSGIALYPHRVVCSLLVQHPFNRGARRDITQSLGERFREMRASFIKKNLRHLRPNRRYLREQNCCYVKRSQTSACFSVLTDYTDLYTDLHRRKIRVICAQIGAICGNRTAALKKSVKSVERSVQICGNRTVQTARSIKS
jgi:hypothetical protein